MYRKALQRAESIGGFIRNEIMIVLGDMAQNHKKNSGCWLDAVLLRMDPARKCTSNLTDFAHVFDEIKYF